MRHLVPLAFWFAPVAGGWLFVFWLLGLPAPLIAVLLAGLFVLTLFVYATFAINRPNSPRIYKERTDVEPL